MIQLEQVSKSFNGRRLFSGINHEVRAGEILVLVGASGVGKSSLLRIVAGLLAFHGKVLINGVEIRGEDPKPTAYTAYVGQPPGLWQHLTALENVALVRRLLFREARQQARVVSRELLEELDVVSVADRFPATLSGGEQQRVGLARGLAADRPVLLLDEVTSNVDSKRRLTVVGAVKAELAKGKCGVFATHDLETARLLTDVPYTLDESGLTPLR
jgi:ABC-type multidrug transport system ATPase subunit